jgi:hypothetical protein
MLTNNVETDYPRFGNNHSLDKISPAQPFLKPR